MRLIHTTNLNLKWFTWKNIPDYAILSHTWESDKQTGESTEVTFRDMTEIIKDPAHPSSKKDGYRKIVSACKVARDNNLEYIWVDTCCIEKESSSELSEAINSMYRWYQNAKVCFAYLSDLKAVDNLELALPKCRWFTRGWCLQELIAPSRVWFFYSNWDYVGSKKRLSQQLFDITQINKEVLHASSLVTSVPVARRMSWAAKRKTSREEDLAYCLLGIFGVNMPMLYGEGPNAFLRLQEQIVLSSNDLSIFAFDVKLKPTIVSGRVVMYYCHMFAKSPDAFRNHAVREYPEIEPRWNEAFAVTNRGIRFQQAEVQTDISNGVYRMILNTEYPSLNHGFIYLRKVGPRLFVRCTFDESDLYSNPSKLLPAHVEEEMYIVKHVTPLRLQQLMDAEKYSIQVTSETHILTPNVFEVRHGLVFSKHWDESRMKYLTQGQNTYGGCWKLYPDFTEPLLRTAVAAHIASQPTNNFVYVACGLFYSKNQRRPKAWVNLYYADESKDMELHLESTLGYYVRVRDLVLSNPHRGDETIITARVELQEENVPQFRLIINMKINTI